MDSAKLELDVPIPGLEKVKDWIPSLNIGGGVSDAFQAIVKKERNIGSTSTKKGRRMKAIDRRKLEASIAVDAHRGLRMLCADEVLHLGIECPVDTSANEFACAKLDDIRLNVSTYALYASADVMRFFHRN